MKNRRFDSRVAPGSLALSLCLAGTMVWSTAFPLPAFAVVTVDDQELSQGENSVGGGSATLWDTLLDITGVSANNLTTDESLTMNFNGGNEIGTVYVGGSSTVDMNFAGENEVEDTHAFDNAQVTIHANGNNEFEDLAAHDNSNLTVLVTGENEFESIDATDNANVTVRGTDCPQRDIAKIGEGEDDAAIKAEQGDVTIDSVTVEFDSETARVGSEDGNVSITTSSISSGDDNEYMELMAGGTMSVSESVIDGVGTMHSDGQMTIEHSDVELDAPDEEYDSSPYRIYSPTGVELIGEENGEVKEGELNGKRAWYVDTGDGKNVDLNAVGKPGYYGTCGGASSVESAASLASSRALPRTVDRTNPWIAAASAIVGWAALALGSTVRSRARVRM